MYARVQTEPLAPLLGVWWRDARVRGRPCVVRRARGGPGRLCKLSCASRVCVVPVRSCGGLGPSVLRCSGAISILETGLFPETDRKIGKQISPTPPPVCAGIVSGRFVAQNWVHLLGRKTHKLKSARRNEKVW